MLALAATTALVAEFACSFLVYSETAASWPLAWRLRDPARFGRYRWDDVYWEMKSRLTPPEQLALDIPHDPVLGWTSPEVSPGDLSHRDEPLLNGRRPLLLFGDSFGHGIGGVTAGTFTRWLEDSELRREWRMLNYSMGGQGLDQILLVMQRAVERHLAERPVVIFSFLVDDDMDRCVLSIRDWPKPRLRLEGGRLVLPDEEVPTLREYLDQRTARTGSVCVDLLRGLLLQRLAPEGTADEVRSKQELARAILRQAVTFLRERQVPFICLLFMSRVSLEYPPRARWRETLAIATLDELDAPWVHVRPAFLTHARLSGRTLDDYFIPIDEFGGGHYNRRGNEVAFQALLEGLEEHLGLGPGGDLSVGLLPRLDPEACTTGSRLAEQVDSSRSLARRGLQAPFVVLAPEPGTAGEGVWPLEAWMVGLRARAALVTARPDEEALGRLEVLVDERPATVIELRSTAEPIDIDVDLRAARVLRLRAELVRSGAGAARIVLDRFEIAADPAAPPIVPAIR